MKATAPIPRVVRTAPQLRAARYALGLSTGGLAKMIETRDAVTVRRWESGETPIPVTVTQLLEVAMDFLMRLEELTERLDTLEGGERLCGGFVCSNAANDISDTEIARVMVVKTLTEIALANLTKQPVPDTDEPPQAHWYSLRRAEGGDAEWTNPAELTPEAALARFERYDGVGDGLTLCEGSTMPMEFILEKRKLLPSNKPGRIVESYAVSRVS